MEVHHHPHVEKKNFKEYFLEFLMIFLAVTLGFFAENFREHIVDKNLEHDYISSLYEDLSNDEHQLPELVESIQYQQLYPADSLQLLLGSATTTTPANDIYRFLRTIVRQQSINAFVTDRTIEQLKNADEMHLISNKQIADSLVDYYKDIAFIAELQQALLAIKSQLANNDHSLLNSYDYDKFSDSSDMIVNPAKTVYLRSTDSDVINDCLMDISNIKGLSRSIKLLILSVAGKAVNIKYLIARNYNIKH